MHFALVGSCRGSWARGLRLLQQAVHVDPVPYSRIVGGKEGLNHNLSALLLAVLGYLAALKISGKRVVGLAVGIGILSHLVLDLITHAPDIVLAPGIDEPKFGFGLYGTAPFLAFVIVYKGSKADLLAV